tara:strand:- start:9989 stop:10465 length:477 start_codon:yes stop_codon:yes gene_type:complete
MIKLPRFRLTSGEMIVDFRPSHADKIELKDRDLYYESIIPNYRQYIAGGAQPGLSWTGIYNNKIVLCFGVRQVWPNVAEAWLLPSPLINDHALSVVRTARKIFSDIFKTEAFSRVHISVDSANDSAFKFAKALGFETEGILRKYGPDGSDYYMMARIK